MSAETNSTPSTLTNAAPEIAFYYPNPVWHSGDWVKNLILFFDGIALLVPEYLRDKPFYSDPAIAEGLDQHGLLHIIEPEKVVDKNATEELATAMTDIIVSGALDKLASEETSFHELSWSRLGYQGDAGLAKMIFEELKSRNLAKDSADGFSIPMHPMVRSLVLVLLAQILRPKGKQVGLDLYPATDRPEIQNALRELLSLPNVPSAGHVVSLDLQAVGVDLSSIPFDEVLDYRKEHLLDYRRYARNVRQFVRDLSLMREEERAIALSDRQEELEDLATGLRNTAHRAWRKPVSFALSIAGAIWKVTHGDVLGGLLASGSSLSGAELIGRGETGAYSYLFDAHSSLG